MINFMLANLYHPSWQFLALFLPVEVIILYFNFLVSGRLTNTVQGQTAFFCLIHITLWNNHRIKHHNIYKSHIHNDNILLYTNPFVLRTQSQQSPNIHASMSAWLVATAYICSHTTHRSRFACNVSCRSFPTWISAFVAGSDGWPKKKMSLTICFTIYVLNVQNTS